MIIIKKTIVKDIMLLSRKSTDATKDDLYITQDLIDTLNAYKESCVGMAANMIGFNKRIIIIQNGLFPMIMINPIITNKSGMYKVYESCLSLIGERECIRYESIEVDYYDTNFVLKHGKYNGFIAEVIQHEIDHLEGIII